MYKHSVRKRCALLSVAVFLLVGCDATDPLDSAEDVTEFGKTLDDSIPDRIISLYLEPQSSNLNTPVFDDRIVTAESVYTVPVTVARGQGLVSGINVVYVGKSCQELQGEYPDIYECAEEKTAEFQYGGIESTVSTDSEGFASMTLGDAEKYRLRVQSFATSEDSKCFWGGEATIDAANTEVSIPLLVFCE